eukprot:jgi/Ulvmu1/11735/UM008_0148.1
MLPESLVDLAILAAHAYPGPVAVNTAGRFRCRPCRGDCVRRWCDMLKSSKLLSACVSNESCLRGLSVLLEACSTTFCTDASSFRSQRSLLDTVEAQSSPSSHQDRPSPSNGRLAGNSVDSQSKLISVLTTGPEQPVSKAGSRPYAAISPLRVRARGSVWHRPSRRQPDGPAKPLPSGDRRVQLWLKEAQDRLAAHSHDSPKLAESIHAILLKLEALPPTPVHARMHDVADTLVHLVHALPSHPPSIPAQLLSLSRALFPHTSLSSRLHAMPAVVFRDPIKNLMNAAASSDVSVNAATMLVRAQLGLRTHCPRLWERLQGRSFREFPPVIISIILNSAASAASVLSHPAPPTPVLRALATAFTGNCRDGTASPRCVAMGLWALGTLQMEPAGSEYQAWARAIAQHAHGMNAREVSAVWVACMRLAWAPRGTAWKQLEEATVRELGSFYDPAGPPPRVPRGPPDAIGIVSVWSAWGKLGVLPEPRVERAMSDALVRVLPSMHVRQASQVLHALARLARVDSRDALAATRARLTELLAVKRTLGPWDAATVLFSLACIVAARHRGRVGGSVAAAAADGSAAPQCVEEGHAAQHAEHAARRLDGGTAGAAGAGTVVVLVDAVRGAGQGGAARMGGAPMVQVGVPRDDAGSTQHAQLVEGAAGAVVSAAASQGRSSKRGSLPEDSAAAGVPEAEGGSRERDGGEEALRQEVVDGASERDFYVWEDGEAAEGQLEPEANTGGALGASTPEAAVSLQAASIAARQAGLGPADEEDVQLACRVLMHAGRLHRKRRPFHDQAMRQIHAACCVLGIDAVTAAAVARGCEEGPAEQEAEGRVAVRGVLSKAAQAAAAEAARVAEAATMADKGRRRQIARQAVLGALEEAGCEMQQQALIGSAGAERTLCVEVLAQQAGRRAALEFVSPHHGIVCSDGSIVPDGPSWLRAAHVRRLGLHMVQVHVKGRAFEELESDAFLRGVRGQLREAGLSV